MISFIFRPKKSLIKDSISDCLDSILPFSKGFTFNSTTISVFEIFCNRPLVRMAAAEGSEPARAFKKGCHFRAKSSGDESVWRRLFWERSVLGCLGAEFSSMELSRVQPGQVLPVAVLWGSACSVLLNPAGVLREAGMSQGTALESRGNQTFEQDRPDV